MKYLDELLIKMNWKNVYGKWNTVEVFGDIAILAAATIVMFAIHAAYLMFLS